MTVSVSREQLHRVRIVRNLLIPLGDGTTLAADLHLPLTSGPHPTLISLYPYRKDDVIGSFTAYARRWFAQRGYAHLLVDVSGYGGSEGRHTESFDPQRESAAARQVVVWAAAQEWSDGAVGVWGVSYGGLMALAAGAARAPHLKAIAPVYPLWNVYDDVVAPGGCPTMITQHQWSTTMLAQRLAPPTFRDPDGRWRQVWRERLEQLEREQLDISRWREHPDREDRFWSQRVLPLEQIEVPTFLIGGWRDLFPQAVVRAFERIPATKRLLFGPWLHVQPDLAAREPVDWLALLIRFWDEHLLGAPPADEPPVLAYVQGSAGWRAERTWPPAGIQQRTLQLRTDGRLDDEGDGGSDEYRATPVVGVTGGQWDAMGTAMGYPLDQGPDDLCSLTYTGWPLEAPLELAGSPQAILEVERLDGEESFALVAKLIDVSPSGSAELITTGWAQSDRGTTTVSLWTTAWALGAGHCLRLSISCADFPRIWPNATTPLIRLHHRGSQLQLPIAPDGIGEAAEPKRPEAVATEARWPWTLTGEPVWKNERDLAKDAVAVTLGGGETIRLPEGGTLALQQRASASVTAEHPENAAVEAEATIEIRTADGERIEVHARSRSWRDRDVYWGRVSVNECRLFERTWRTL